MSKIMTKFYSLPDTTRENIEVALGVLLGTFSLFAFFQTLIYSSLLLQKFYIF